MSRSSTRSFITHLFMFVAALTLVAADIVVSGQNSNSSTTMQDTNTSMANMNTGGTTRRRRGSRRARRRRGMTMSNANAACGPMQENTNMAEGAQENANTMGAANGNMNMGGRRRRGRRRAGNMSTGDTTAADMGTTTMTPVRTGRCDPNQQEQTDLSGTYTGNVNYPEGGLSGDATLTITGNNFTLTSGSSSQEGRVVAVTTCDYTAVTMMFGQGQTTAASGPQPAALPAVSLRARRTGGGVTLMSVPGEKREFSFSASGGGSSSGGRRRGSRKVGIKPPTVR